MTLTVNLGDASYGIVLERGCLDRAAEHLDLCRRVLVVTDAGVPKAYAERLAAQCRAPRIVTVPEGESSKSVEGWTLLLREMLDGGFSRGDCVVAVGGGVVGDLAGFAASAYMRGIDFYNIPTTLLSQIDSSIGGKTAINFGGVKNVVGAFYQPKKVLVDPDLLTSLPARQISNGLAEALKVALTSDETLFSILEEGNIEKELDEIIRRALLVKKAVVEQDEREAGLRRVLNFGHTVGHGSESTNQEGLYHGECVALGMLPMLGEALRPRVVCVLRALGLYRTPDYDWDKIRAAMLHDKKANGDTVTVVTVEEIGSFRIEKMPCLALIERAGNVLEG